MKKGFFVLIAVLLLPLATVAQTDKIMNFDYDADGPWNDPELTDMEVPKLPVGAIVLDGDVSAAEYGGFESIDIIPAESGWPLNWPGDRSWDGPDDSSFKFYLAHDENYLYLGVDVKDDVLRQDAEHPNYWQDDCIEVLILPTNLTPPDTMGNPRNVNGGTFDWGTHTYFTYNGKMRDINEDGEDTLGYSFAASDWTFGPDGDVTSVATETDTGWAVEVRFAKFLFEGTDLPFYWLDKLDQTYDVDLEEHPISFGLAVDDDDGVRADQTGFELQYWWPVTDRLASGFGPDQQQTWYSDEIAAGEHIDYYGTEPGERLDGGALGIIRLSSDITPVGDWTVY
jgi:hypothetical protein